MKKFLVIPLIAALAFISVSSSGIKVYAEEVLGKNTSPKNIAAKDNNENNGNGNNSQVENKGESKLLIKEFKYEKPEDIIKERNQKNLQLERLRIKNNVKLDAEKLKNCEAKQAEIKKRTEQLIKFTENMLGVFDTISTRAQNYYKKYVDGGGTAVSNYDELISDIALKKALVKADLETAKEDSAKFTCTGEDPKGYLELFREEMKTVKSDLKLYRTTIKNLIVAIHPESDTEETETPTQEVENSGEQK